MDRLFVYGSLKAGGSAHQLLRGAIAEAGGALDQVNLIEYDGYPMLRAGSTRVEVRCIGSLTPSGRHWMPGRRFPGSTNAVVAACRMDGGCGFYEAP